MTRAQFLNDMYRRLCGNGMDRDQAEQHLTYYAEMLADRMEEGMTEDQAVNSMEDLETIVRRILEEEGLAYNADAVTPPSYPDVTKLGGGGGGGGGGFKRAYRAPKKPDKQKLIQAALWAAAIVVVLVSASRWLLLRNQRNYSTSVVDYASESPAMCEPDIPQEAAPYVDGYTDALEAPYDAGYMFGGFTMTVDGGTAIDSIEIQWAAGTVYVQSWNQNEIQVQEYTRSPVNDQTVCSSDVKDGKLTVSYRKSLGLGVVKDEKWLLVLVPDGRLGDLRIETTSADIQLISLEQENLAVSTNSGDINLEECYANKVNLSSISGDINLSGLFADELEVSSTSGCIYGIGDSVSVTASTVSGDITLNAGPGTNTFQLSSVSGDIWLSVDNPATQSIGADTASGDVSINIPYDMGFALAYTTISGNIQSNSYDLAEQNGKYLHNGGGCEISVNTVNGDLDIY